MNCRTRIGEFAAALAVVEQVLCRNEPKHRGRCRRQPVAAHVRHAAGDLQAYSAGDRDDDHLGHDVCRLLMALTLASEGDG